MSALARPFRRLRVRAEPASADVTASAPARPTDDGPVVDIPETDPLFAYLQATPGPVDLGRLELSSPALEELRAAGVALVVPLVSQGELIGTLNLGPRLSEQDYSTDDRRLLATSPRRPRPRSASRSWSGSRRPRPPSASASSRSSASPSSSSSSSCPARCRTSRTGTSPRTTARRASSAATSTTSWSSPTAASASWSGM